MQSHCILRLSEPAIAGLTLWLRDGGRHPGDFPPPADGAEPWPALSDYLDETPYVPLHAVASSGVASPGPVMELPAVVASVPTDAFRLGLALRACGADSEAAVAMVLEHLTEACALASPAVASAMLRAVTSVQGHNPLDESRHRWGAKKTRLDRFAEALHATEPGKDAHPSAPAAPLRAEACGAIVHAAFTATEGTPLFAHTPAFAVTDADRRLLASGSIVAAWRPALERRSADQQTGHRGKDARTVSRVGSATLRRDLWRSLVASARLPCDLHFGGGGDAGPETSPDLPVVPGQGPRWGSQMRMPTFVDATATTATVEGTGAPEPSPRHNVRFWAAVILNLEAFTRDGTWLFARMPTTASVVVAAPVPAPTAISVVAMGDWGEDGDGLRRFEASVKALLRAKPSSPPVAVAAEKRGDAAAADDDVDADSSAATKERQRHVVGAVPITEPINPSAMLALGDNFYPSGITTVYDRRLMYQFRNRFQRRDRAAGGGRKKPAVDGDAPGHAMEALPWMLALGNHDYNGDPRVQLALSDASSANPNGLWRFQGDDPCLGPNRNYATAFHTADCDVHVFVVDVNAVQFSVRRLFPDIVKRYEQEDLPWLRRELSRSVAAERESGRKTWRIVCAHQPMFTDGRGHGNEALCLQGDAYEAIGKDGEVLPGLNLQKTFDEFNVHSFLAGHEHVLQFTRKKYTHGECMHAVVGAPVETHFYKGPLSDAKDRMVDKAYRGTCGFATLRADAASLELTFWGIPYGGGRGESAMPVVVGREKIQVES